jgi:RNA polymerase sigma-70 factor (ECF subfamily)
MPAFTLVVMETLAHESGQSERIAGWVRDHGGAVRGYVRAMVARNDLVDDLVQEVFFRAWQGRSGYEERGRARAYLLQIADRVVCDRFRRAKPETTLGDKVWELGELHGSAADPAVRAAATEAALRLQDALNELTPIQRRALLLRYYGELSFSDIAATLGCPLGTALSHCRRGLQTLRSFLEGDRP